MPLHVHVLPPGHHFLREKRKDPVTQSLLKAGDRVVICACHKLAFLEGSWPMMADSHGGMNHTAEALPTEQGPISFGNSGRRRSPPSPRPSPSPSPRPSPRPQPRPLPRFQPRPQQRFRMGPVQPAPGRPAPAHRPAPPPPAPPPPASPRPAPARPAPASRPTAEDKFKSCATSGCGCLFWGFVALTILRIVGEFL